MKIQAEDFLKQENLSGGHAYYAVAGGALRDIILGKEVKDVDLFILPSSSSYVNLSCPNPRMWVTSDKRDRLEFVGVWENNIFKEAENWHKFELEKQGEGESECGEDFSSYLCPDIPGLNVIVLGPTVRTVHGVSNNDQLIKYLFHSFPCNMSKIALNSDGLHVHDSFWDGVRDKQFVYEMSKIKNNYIERMERKYPAPWKHDSVYTISMSTTKGLGIKSVSPSLWSPSFKGSV